MIIRERLERAVKEIPWFFMATNFKNHVEWLVQQVNEQLAKDGALPVEVPKIVYKNEGW